MRCPRLAELPPPPPGKTGWPWTEETPPLPETRPDGSPWPKISMVTPSYNQADFVEETIRAVLLQGYPNLEYIVSEDCSTDGSLAIIEKYSAWLDLVTAPQNGGMSKAINRGWEACSGEILTWIATDDVYEPGAFAAVARHWPAIAGYGAVVGAFRYMDEHSRVEARVHRPQLPGDGPHDLTLLPIGSWRLHQVATFYLCAALDEVGRFVREDLRHNMDRELIYRVARDHRVFLVEEPLAAFRMHSQSKSWSLGNMIRMAREYASIQDLFATGDPAEDAVRRKIGRQRIAKGYAKYAKYHPNPLVSAWALVKALRFYPRYLTRKNYFKAWAIAMGLRRPLKRFLGRGAAV